MTDTYYSSPDQSIPFSPEAEEALLGAVLTNVNAYYSVAAFVRAEDFYLLRHRWIWQAVARIVERGEAYDFLTVGQELRGLNRFEEVGGQPYLLHLISNTPTSVHAEVYGRLVERAALRRRLLEASDYIRLLALDEEKAIETVTEEAESYLLKVTESQLKRDIVPIRDAVSEYFERIEHLIANRDLALGLPTTFKALDTLLGGLQKSDLLIFAGRPGMGKTAFMLSVALNAARFEKRIAIFTMEMGAEQIVQRLISMETGINMQKLRLGQIDHAEWQRLVEAVGRLSKFNIFIDDTPAMTPLQMRTKCRRLAHEHGVDLVIVDYIQLMNAGGIYENNRVQEVSYISRSLKELARELNVPVFSAAQLSRAVEQRQDKRPQLSDLRESGCLAGDSRVYLPDTGRYVPIRDLNGQSGFRVLSLNTATRRLESAAVSHAFCTGVKPVYRLRTRLGRSIRATANHKFYTITGWKRLDELTVGDHIALPRVLRGPQSQTMEDAELALLAHLIGDDGCTLPKHAIQYTTCELRLAESVVEFAQTVFADEFRPRIYKEPGRTWYQVFLPPARHLTHGVHNPIRLWLDDMGAFGFRSFEKAVPDRVFEQTNNGIALFLRHLWATDGHISTKKTTKGRYPAVYYATSSRRLAWDVQSLLLRLEINAVLKRVPQNGKGRDQYHIVVTGNSDLRLFIEHIGAFPGSLKEQGVRMVKEYLETHSTNTNRDVIPSVIWKEYALPAMQRSGLTSRQMQAALGTAYCGTTLYRQNVSRERALRLANVLGDEDIDQLATSNIYWDTVLAVEPDGESDVYDLTVPGNSSFVADNIIVHNSIEQDADIVMFLYRDEVYNEATEHPNQADIIVAKHRNGPTGVVSLYFDRSITRFLDSTRHSVDLSHHT